MFGFWTFGVILKCCVLLLFQCYDEFYPIHHAALLDIKFLELLIQCGAETTVRTSTQLMTALHVVLLQGKKSAEDTLQVREQSQVTSHSCDTLNNCSVVRPFWERHSGPNLNSWCNLGLVYEQCPAVRTTVARLSDFIWLNCPDIDDVLNTQHLGPMQF